MKNNFVSLLSAAAAIALATLTAAPAMAADQAGASKPAGSISASGTLTAAVTKIDETDRWVTLKMPDGSLMDVHAGPEVKNFA